MSPNQLSPGQGILVFLIIVAVGLPIMAAIHWPMWLAIVVAVLLIGGKLYLIFRKRARV